MVLAIASDWYSPYDRLVKNVALIRPPYTSDVDGYIFALTQPPYTYTNHLRDDVCLYIYIYIYIYIEREREREREREIGR